MSFRPANAISLNDLTAKEAENVVYESEFTVMFHIFLALAASCLAWVFMLNPLMSRNKTIFGSSAFIWLFVLPIVVLASGALTDSVMNRENQLFVYLKFASVWGTMLILFGFVLFGDSKNLHKIRTIVITTLFLANILEASFDQIINGFKITDTINGSLGIVLGLLLIGFVYFSKGIDVVKTKDTMFLNFKLSTFFILAYTFWNILFRSYLLENTGTVLFTIVSLLLPLVLHFMGIGNWFQNIPKCIC